MSDNLSMMLNKYILEKRQKRKKVSLQSFIAWYKNDLTDEDIEVIKDGLHFDIMLFEYILATRVHRRKASLPEFKKWYGEELTKEESDYAKGEVKKQHENLLVNLERDKRRIEIVEERYDALDKGNPEMEAYEKGINSYNLYLQTLNRKFYNFTNYDHKISGEEKKKAYERDIVGNKEVLDRYEAYLVNRFKDKIKDKYNLQYYYHYRLEMYIISFKFRKSRWDTLIYTTTTVDIEKLLNNDGKWDTLNIECWIDPDSEKRLRPHIGRGREAEKLNPEFNIDEYIH